MRKRPKIGVLDMIRSIRSLKLRNPTGTGLRSDSDFFADILPGNRKYVRDSSYQDLSFIEAFVSSSGKKFVCTSKFLVHLCFSSLHYVMLKIY
jgi:hypothetical protein